MKASDPVELPRAAALPVLDGTRLTLRAHREEDLPAFFALYADPRVTRYWSFPAWTDIEQARERFDGVLDGNDPARMLGWAIATRDDDRLIGGVTLFGINQAQGRAELGYSLHTDHWGHGYAREAVALVLAHAFDVLHLRRIEADIDPRNAASCRLVQRFGFVHEGVLRERWHVAGELCDTALYGLLERDWRALQRDAGDVAAD